jgi:serine/threonine protein kinase
MKAELGTAIDGKFSVLEALGTGGFGTVYRARQLQFDREVAIKVLDVPEFDESLLKRFEREAKILQQFQTKYIPTIYGYGLWDGRPYMAMELVDGPTLQNVLQAEHSLPLERLQSIIADVATALEYAHQRGIVHRDLSPANIILVQNNGKEEARIIDFGLATFSELDLRNRQQLTETGYAVGSFHYMSPEQCMAEPVDGRTDIYSLGCVIFRALTGQLPYEADNELLLMRKHVNEATPHIPSQFPESIQTVIDKTMAKNRSQRYANASEFLEDWRKLKERQAPRSPLLLVPSLTFLAVALSVVAAMAIWNWSIVTPKQSAREPMRIGVDLAESFGDVPLPEQPAVVEKTRKLFESAIEINDRTHEFSPREFELACQYLARAYHKQNRNADALKLAKRAIDAQLNRGVVTPLLIRTYATAALALERRDKERVIEDLKLIVMHNPPFVLPSQGEARMSLAELLVSEGRKPAAKQFIPRFEQLGDYELSADRWQECMSEL